MPSHSVRTRLMATSLLAGATALAAPLLAVSVLALSPSTAAAQDYTSGDLTGRVETDTGMPVPGATITVKSSQGQTRTATSGPGGAYRIPGLAAGAYTASVSANGLNPLSGQRVVVQAGGSAFTFSLSTGTVSEVVVTGSSRVSQDFARTDTGLVVDVQDVASRVPIGRTITSVVQLSPSSSLTDPTLVANGVRRSSQTVSNLAGASGAESAYYINGLNVTDQRTGLGFSELPLDAIQTVDVKTGGYAAEFGRSTGGVVNIVTRSGSNEFHAGASLFWTPNSLREKSPTAHGPGASNVSGTVVYNDIAQSSVLDSDLWASGPIWKDHLFFFGLINPRETHGRNALTSNGPTGANALNGVYTTNKTDSPRWLAKLDFNITDRQRLEATVFSDQAKTLYQSYTANINTGASAVAPSYYSKSGGLNEILRYTGVWTDWFTLSALYGKVRSNYTDVGPLASTPRVRDLSVAGQTTFLAVNGATANTATLFNLADKDIRDTYRIDADFYANLLGSHHFRIGYDLEKLKTTDQGAYNGGYIMDVRQSSSLGLYALKTVYLTGGAFTADQSAYYAQDSWQILSNLTLQLGVRNDVYDYKNSAGQSFVKRNKQWAPRLGFAWDPFKSGDDKVYGSYGHYYLPLAENLAIRGSGANPYYQDYYRVTRDAAGNIVRDSSGLPVLGATIQPRNVLQTSAVPDYRAVVAQNASPMYSEEFILGWDHTFRGDNLFKGALDGWHTGIRYIDRKLKKTLEDTNLQISSPEDDPTGSAYGTGAIANYCKRNNISAATCTATSTYEGHFAVVNPGSGARVFVDLTGKGGQFIDLTAADLQLPKAANRYQALEFTLERPFDGKWGVQGSYVLARGRGNYTGAVNNDIGQTDTSATQDFDQPWNEIGATGNLSTVARHTIKLYGSYEILENLNLGANFLAQSGRYYSCLGYAPQQIAVGAAFGTPSTFYCPRGASATPTLVPRGTGGVTPWFYQLDLNLSYKIPTPDDFGGLTVSLEVFNLFNAKTATRAVEQGETTNLAGTPTSFYGLARNYQPPRTVRFGIRYAY